MRCGRELQRAGDRAKGKRTRGCNSFGIVARSCFHFWTAFRDGVRRWLHDCCWVRHKDFGFDSSSPSRLCHVRRHCLPKSQLAVDPDDLYAASSRGTWVDNSLPLTRNAARANVRFPPIAKVRLPCMMAHMKFHSAPWLLCVLLLTSCSGEAGQTAGAASSKQDEELRRYLETPQYGGTRPLSGKAMFGRETSIIGLCDKGRADCELPRNVDGSEQPCWLEFTERASADRRRLTRANYPEDGEYWIEGEGRVAVQPGGFGHLSEYTCQVELVSVRVIETGPPHFWQPPLVQPSG